MAAADRTAVVGGCLSPPALHKSHESIVRPIAVGLSSCQDESAAVWAVGSPGLWRGTRWQHLAGLIKLSINGSFGRSPV
jgi:hypothetical protein